MDKTTIILVVINQKGGVGKTTTTLNLSHALSQRGKKILLIDSDPQGHLGNCLGLNEHNGQGLDEVLLHGVGIEQLTKNIRPDMDILISGCGLGEMESKTDNSGATRGYRLHDALAFVKNDGIYDYIIVDCPPAAGLLAMNAILAADQMLIPVTGDYLALQGLSRLIQVLSHIEKRLEKSTKKWFVLTRFHERRKLAKEIRSKMINYFPAQVLKTSIRENVSLAESPGFGQTIFEYQPKSNGSKDYWQLADDFLQRRTF
ncbi:MAG: ParA family protein [Pseudomonadota bacterium]